PALEESLQITQYELAVLLGRAPRDEVQITGDTLPEIGFLPEPGLPADLLARRPDIRSAGLQLHAADWRVSAAKADRLPALRLNASASYGSEEWALLFDNWMASLAAGITGPVFDAGRRKAEVRRTQAIVKERLAVYRQKVLDSVKEVESAMMRETKQQEYVDALEREYNTAQATHEQALQRYKNGIIDYLPVLTALTQLQTVERKVLKAKQIRLEYRIQLYTALGGGWMEEEIHRSKDDK
ncbi:MAG: TolC family protein, partial [Candidatus Hydrogenedentes bacterium]|nr:TolC family protein [Candidatus Hydrogenedentota bacterium]